MDSSTQIHHQAHPNFALVIGWPIEFFFYFQRNSLCLEMPLEVAYIGEAIEFLGVAIPSGIEGEDVLPSSQRNFPVPSVSSCVVFVTYYDSSP